MGIQSTTRLTRKSAEERALDKLLRTKYEKIARAEICIMSDEELEYLLESTFDNYMITCDEWED